MFTSHFADSISGLDLVIFPLWSHLEDIKLERLGLEQHLVRLLNVIGQWQDRCGSLASASLSLSFSSLSLSLSLPVSSHFLALVFSGKRREKSHLSTTQSIM